MSNVLGVVVIARNGDRVEYYQNPNNYRTTTTETTALGEVQSHQLGCFLRSEYFDRRSPSYINDMNTELVDNSELHVRVKGGGEGTVVFDSAIALLQGLFPPNPNNKIVLANETTIVAPMGGYQYVPVETVSPGTDRSLESWTGCPAFEEHIQKFYSSDAFKTKAKEAEPFFNGIRDYVFGRPLSLRNIWNIYDFVNSELTHNKTYAHRLPPTYIEQARGWANYHEDGVFSDKHMSGIGNIAGRTVLHTIIESLERIAFNGDPLQFLLIESTYQPFISLFHQTEMASTYPDLHGIPDYASALAIELRRGPPPEDRDFLRFKFKNGTEGDFEIRHVFGHKGDIPLTEFIYKIQNAAITSNQQWAKVCSATSATGDIADIVKNNSNVQTVASCALAFVLLLGLFVASRWIKRSRAQSRLRLPGDEIVPVAPATAEKRRFV